MVRDAAARFLAAMLANPSVTNLQALRAGADHGEFLLDYAIAMAERLAIDTPPGGSLGSIIDGIEVRTLREAVAAFEDEIVARAIAAAGGNKTKAAGILGVSARTLFNKVRKRPR